MGLTALNLVLIDILRNICEISSCMHYTSFILKQISLIPFDTLISFPNQVTQMFSHEYTH